MQKNQVNVNFVQNILSLSSSSSSVTMPSSIESAFVSEFVWQYYTIDEKDSTKAICTKCQKKISRGLDKAKMSVWSNSSQMSTFKF